ncbi:ATP-binding protein [Streptomyces sp. NBC_01180]|uniref:ATP-binding protein n=1 Tax=Streptomyces sp. NBC_01180 TaxID=2903763 RepID=UPI00386AC9BE|nr:ATP-binding protein [Streptomyces sp. NBC_01180]
MSETTTTDTEGSASCLVLEDDSPAGVPRARDIARVFADRLEPALAAETAETLALVVTELTTNALRHGGGRYTLELSAGPDMVNVAVSDLSREPPRMRAPDLNGGTGGFGWHMIRRLTCSVTTSRGPGQGKTIRASLPR